VQLGSTVSGRIERARDNSIQYTAEQIERLLNSQIERENRETDDRLERENREANARIRQIKAETAE
jgi:hypothetical protein